jgi:hypothetical protein
MRVGVPVLGHAARAALLCAAVLAGGACGGKAGAGPGDSGTGATGDGGVGVEGGAVGADGGAQGGDGGSTGPVPVPAKIDVLFMIDNSASMGDKQALLASAVPDMLERLAVVSDMHVGIVTSSLGGRGGDQCPINGTNPAAPALNAHNDDRGELVNRGGVLGDPTVESPVADIAPSNFLSWFPSVAANQGKPAPPTTAIGDASRLVTDFTTMVAGVHEHGCGFEAQNEAWYRFLVQPDPFDAIAKNGTQAILTGVDATILQQRHDFLRPDSLLIVFVVTDENEEATDPLAINGQAWALSNQNFPGSPNGAAPEGSIECQQLDPNDPLHTGPNNPACTSCAFIAGDPSFATRCPKDGANGANGFLDPNDDSLNTRFFHQKMRFGLFAGYPVSRYVNGLTSAHVPSTAEEHDNTGNYVGDAQGTCVNPIFAASLPTDPKADLCHLPPGTRDPRLVFYAAIAGVPHQLLQQDPTDPNSLQKATLSDADWLRIHGQDPEHYDFRGADFHMVESWDARTTQGVMANASSCPPTAADNCDPINGREWDPKRGDLEFSCIFPLAQPKDCSAASVQGACDCATGALNSGTQLCQKDASGQYTTTQINGKAYPSVREMLIAHALGQQGVVSSICPIHVTEQTPGDRLFGYRPAMDTLMARVTPLLPK